MTKPKDQTDTEGGSTDGGGAPPPVTASETTGTANPPPPVDATSNAAGSPRGEGLQRSLGEESNTQESELAGPSEDRAAEIARRVTEIFHTLGLPGGESLTHALYAAQTAAQHAPGADMRQIAITAAAKSTGIPPAFLQAGMEIAKNGQITAGQDVPREHLGGFASIAPGGRGQGQEIGRITP